MSMDLEKQLELIYQWFQKKFDNHMQCQFERELQKRDGSEPLHGWVFSVLTAASAPRVGTHVLLAKRGFRDTGKIYRRRMYSFHVNEEAGRVQNDIYRLKDESLFDRFEEDPSVVSSLDPSSDAEKIEGCSISWEYLPDKNCFHGTVAAGTCQFQSTYFPGKTIIATSDTIIGPDYMWTRDRGVDLDGNKMYGFKSDEHHKCLQCTPYKGVVSFGTEKQTQEIVIHNQGGEMKIGEAKCSVKLAQSVDLESRATVLRLSVHRDGQDEAVGMALADPDSSVIGGVFAGGVKVHLVRQM